MKVVYGLMVEERKDISTQELDKSVLTELSSVRTEAPSRRFPRNLMNYFNPVKVA